MNNNVLRSRWSHTKLSFEVQKSLEMKRKRWRIVGNGKWCVSIDRVWDVTVFVWGWRRIWGSQDQGFLYLRAHNDREEEGEKEKIDGRQKNGKASLELFASKSSSPKKSLEFRLWMKEGVPYSRPSSISHGVKRLFLTLVLFDVIFLSSSICTFPSSLLFYNLLWEGWKSINHSVNNGCRLFCQNQLTREFLSTRPFTSSFLSFWKNSHTWQPSTIDRLTFYSWLDFRSIFWWTSHSNKVSHNQEIYHSFEISLPRLFCQEYFTTALNQISGKITIVKRCCKQRKGNKQQNVDGYRQKQQTSFFDNEALLFPLDYLTFVLLPCCSSWERSDFVVPLTISLSLENMTCSLTPSLLLFVLSFSLNSINVHLHPSIFLGRPWGEHGMTGRPARKSFLLMSSHGGEQPDIPERWFTQTLDHFNPTDTRTWKQVTGISNWYLAVKVVTSYLCFVSNI